MRQGFINPALGLRGSPLLSFASFRRLMLSMLRFLLRPFHILGIHRTTRFRWHSGLLAQNRCGTPATVALALRVQSGKPDATEGDEKRER